MLQRFRKCQLRQWLPMANDSFLACRKRPPFVLMTKAPSDMGIVALTPGDQWIISGDDWEDATEATCEQLDL